MGAEVCAGRRADRAERTPREEVAAPGRDSSPLFGRTILHGDEDGSANQAFTVQLGRRKSESIRVDLVAARRTARGKVRPALPDSLASHARPAPSTAPARARRTEPHSAWSVTQARQSAAFRRRRRRRRRRRAKLGASAAPSAHSPEKPRRPRHWRHPLANRSAATSRSARETPAVDAAAHHPAKISYNRNTVTITHRQPPTTSRRKGQLRPGALSFTSCNSQPLPSGSLKEANVA